MAGWKHKTKIIVGNDKNPTKMEAGQVIINKKATKNNLDKLIEINNDGLDSPKEGVTTDGTDGGLLKGKPHYDKNGNSLGGIPVEVNGGKKIEVEGDEFVVNKEASQKHWKELSKINQSAGNGVPIHGSDVGVDEDPEEFAGGGKIEFNPNHLPSKKIYNYAKMVKQKYPKVWDMGGNIFGNEAFKNLERVLKRGYWTDNEEWMYKKWRSYVARHHKDFRIAGTVAMLKWVDKSDKGWPYMKDLIQKEIDKKYEKKKEGGPVTYKNKYNKKYGYNKNESHDLKEIAKDTGVSKKGLQQIYNKGVGAYNTNPQSVRPTVKSEEQWGMGRVYSAVMGGKAAKIDAKELKMEKGGSLDYDNINTYFKNKFKNKTAEDLTKFFIKRFNKKESYQVPLDKRKDLWENSENRLVNVDDLVPSQSYIDKNIVEKYKKEKFYKDILGISIPNSNYIVIFDGHHTFAAQILNGEKYVKVKIIPTFALFKHLQLKMDLGGPIQNSPLNIILEKVKPYQDELTERWVKAINEEGKIKLSDWDIEMYQFMLVMDLTKAIGNYLEKTDSIKDLKFSKQQGSITISCTVVREEKEYYFSTEVIIAGGYNIQKLHLRYIVHTTLPNKKSNPEYEKLNEQYKKMTKAQKIQEEISYAKNAIAKYEVKLNEAKANSKLSDSEVEKLSREDKPDSWKNADLTWVTMIERGADKNFDYDKSKFEESQKEYKKSLIKFWRTFNANYSQYENMIKREQKEIDKFNKKLAELGVTKMEFGGEIEFKKWQQENKPNQNGITEFELKDRTSISVDWINSIILISKKLRGLDYVENIEDYGKGSFEDRNVRYNNFLNRVKELALGEVSFEINYLSNNKQHLIQMQTGGNINKADIYFSVHGLIQTPNPDVMYHSLFDKVNGIEKAKDAAKVMFEVDKDLDRVEIIGDKTKTLYYAATKNTDGSLNFESKDLISKQIQNVAIGGRNYGEKTGKYHLDFLNNFSGKDVSSVIRSVYKFPNEEDYNNVKEYIKENKIRVNNYDDINNVVTFDEQIMELGGELKKGIEAEKEHIGTAEKLYQRQITPSQSAESIAKEHLKEDPKYYTKLETIEKPKIMENLYYLAKGNTITEKSSGYTMKIESYTKNGVLVKKATRFENLPSQELKFEHIKEDVEKGLITFDGKEYATDRDKALLETEIHNIKESFKMATGGGIGEILKFNNGGTIYDKIKEVPNWKFTKGYGAIFNINGKKIGFLAYNNGDENKNYSIGEVLNISNLKKLSGVVDNSIILHIQAYFYDKATKMTKMELSGNDLYMLIVTNHEVNDFQIYKHTNKKEHGGGVGDIIRIAKDMPYMASLGNLYGKDLKVIDVKDVFFASGNQKYFTVDVDGEQYEVPERFTENKMMAGGNLENKLNRQEYLGKKYTEVSNKINNTYKEYEELFNEQYSKFNKEQKEGMEKLNELGLAYIKSGKQEDKKAYEDYGKEYNEIFENHNKKLEKLRQDREFWLDDLNKELKKISSEMFSKMETGGSISNNYEGKSPKDIWGSWSKEQRKHFLYDHQSDARDSDEVGGSKGYYYSDDIDKWVEMEWNELPYAMIKNLVFEHTDSGQYANGGGVEGFERLPKSIKNNELYVTFNNFKSTYDSLMNGNDFDEKRFQGVINDLIYIKNQAKKFKSSEEIEGTEYMATGGVTYYNKDNEYKLGRPSGSIEKEILDKVPFKSVIDSERFIGNFGWKTTQGKLGDGYLYELDEFDQDFTKDLKLKNGEKVFRYVNRTTAIGGITPFIKINVDKALLYFTIQTEKDEVIFDTKGVKPLWINLIEK